MFCGQVEQWYFDEAQNNDLTFNDREDLRVRGFDQANSSIIESLQLDIGTLSR